MQYRKQGRPQDEWQRAARALCAAQDAFQTARQVLLQDEKGRPFGPLAEALPDEHAAYEAGWRAVRAAVQPEWPAACAALRMAAEALQDAAYDTATAFLGRIRPTMKQSQNTRPIDGNWNRQPLRPRQ